MKQMKKKLIKMSLLDAAYEVLQKSGSPMSPADIIRPVLEYGNIRFPVSKTPSDYRSNRNTLSQIENRCF